MFLISTIALFITTLSNLFLGFLIFLKNPKNKINISYFLFAFGIAGWAFTNAIFQITDNSRLAYFMAIAAYYAGAMIALPFFYFTLVFPRGYSSFKKYHGWLLLFWTIIWFAIITTPDITLKNISFHNGTKGLITGPGLFFHFISIIILMLGGIYNLIIKLFRIGRILRHQILYILLGISIMTIFGIIFNLIMPLFGNYSLVWLGPIFSLALTSAMAYTIIRYYLMDIKVIIRLGTIYSILFSVVSFIFIFLISLLGIYIEHYSSHFVASMLIVVGFIPLKNLVENLTDKIFFRKRVKIEDVINRLNNIIHSSFTNLDQLLDNFNRLIIECIRVERAAILILIPKGNFVSRQLIDENVKELKMNPDNPIINFFKDNPLNPIIDKEILNDNSVYQDIVFKLEKLNFSLAVPIRIKEKLIGVYFIGAKKSQDSFTKEDVNLLELLATESAFAIDNARLFEEFKKIDETKSKFIAVVSHQLRTPLTSLLWNIEMMTKKEADEKTKKELLDCVYENAIFINSHIDDMLIALELDKNKKQEFHLVEKNNFEEALEKVLQTLAPEFKKKNISIKAERMDNIPQFLFNRRKIEKSLTILLRNAVMYSPENGEIKIKCEQKEINNKRYLVFSISDRGIGIANDEKSKIFSKFYRSGEAQIISPNGFGLDLFIVKNFIEAHNGEIWFDSDGRDKGATFSFSLPLG